MYKLKYSKIPEKWINGLPIGNGRLAAMYWGDNTKDIFSMNHEYLWRGKYRGKESNMVADKLPVLRELLKKRDYFRATVYANLFWGGLGGDSGTLPGRLDSYQPAGNLVFEFSQATEKSESELDIVRGVTSSIRNGEVRCEAFCDSNDGCTLMRWKSNKKFAGKLYFNRENDQDAEYESIYSVEGINFTCRFICGIYYRVEVKMKTNGIVHVGSDGILITDASEVICVVNIILSDGDICDCSFDFDSISEKHVTKFRSYMDRVSFKLDISDTDECIDTRIKKMKAGARDDKLQELYFHFGRYLMISSCICGKLPPNLQGKWNEKLNPMWKSDYHLDINLQMNEWMIESTNLSEFAVSLTDFMLKFLDGGRKTAKNLYGCRGICLPLSSDVWAECTPEAFGYAVWIGAAAWMAQPLWKHYIYTGDTEYLRNKAYQFFKEIALFYEDFLEEDENGIMQIMPSQSPENRFVGSGKLTSVSICKSSAIDVQLAYDALGYAIDSAEILQIDSDKVENWKILRSKLPPFSIGNDGRLLEWNEEFVEEQPGHKHLSHLYGLYPSDIFTPESRKREYEAAIKSLEYRLAHGGGYTGWSRAWIANIYARIGDSNEFYSQISGLLQDFATESLLDIHPHPVYPDQGIFQIDGNFGMVSAVSEALCSFFDGKVHVLHALPESWEKGHILGIKLPGGHTISLSWEKGKAKELELTMGFCESVVIVVNGKEMSIRGKQGEKIKVNV